MSVIYEVNLIISTRVQKDFETWLKGHIPQVLQFKGFQSARWCKEERDIESQKEKVLWTIQYELMDRNSLEEYFTQHAPKMREEAIQRFGDAFEVRRRILEITETFIVGSRSV